MKRIYSVFLILLCILFLNNITIFADEIFFDEHGNLLYYSIEFNGSEKMTIPEISRNNALETAVKFIKENAANTLKEINTDNVSIVYSKSYPYGYVITFPRIINNIEYGNDNVSLFIDSKNGKVVSYLKNFSDDIVVESNNSIIELSEAKKQYQTAFGMHLQYNKKIKNNKIETYLTYTADDILINAQTGNIISVPYYIPTDGYFDVVNTAEKVSEYIDDEHVLTISEANTTVHGISELEISEEYRISSADYLKNHDDTYLISLLYKNGMNSKEVTLNAKTGLLVEYSDYSNDINYTTDSPESFVEKHYSEYCNNVIKRKSSDGIYTVLLYERTVNDIPYKSNGIYACYENGKLKKLSFAWDNVEFQPTNNIIPLDYAYQQFFDKNGLELAYHKRDNGILTPVYKKANAGTGIFDAESGRQLNYDGSFFYSVKEMNYLDINTHYAGYAANALSDCNIHVSSGNVFLEDNITQQEYLLLISEFIDGTKPVLNTTGILTDDQREMLYAYMYENGIICRAETDYTGFVTRANAIKYFLRILGHGTIGEMSDIFITHFSDSDNIPKDAVGYVELARSLGIINGSTNNRFNPDNFLTNGDSLIIMYNYLKTQG